MPEPTGQLDDQAISNQIRANDSSQNSIGFILQRHPHRREAMLRKQTKHRCRVSENTKNNRPFSFCCCRVTRCSGVYFRNRMRPFASAVAYTCSTNNSREFRRVIAIDRRLDIDCRTIPASFALVAYFRHRTSINDYNNNTQRRHEPSNSDDGTSRATRSPDRAT
jgi:hypothetical protein